MEKLNFIPGYMHIQGATSAKPSSRPRRVRTARARLVEFFLVPDVPWSLFLAFVTTALLWSLTPMPLATTPLVFAGLSVGLFMVLWLALINCNPYAPGTTRLGQLRGIERALPFTEITRSTDLSRLHYPLVFKPSLCSTNSSNVRLIASAEEAAAYMAETEEEVVWGQVFHPGEEFTIMWERWPWRRRGRVAAIVWRRKLHPPGEFHPLSGNGTPKRNIPADELRTPELVRAVEATVARMPGVYCTRFDVRADSPAAVARGEFGVLESNGCVGVPGGTLLRALVTHWPRRAITGLYNMLTHPDARLHPRVFVERMRRFMLCGGWDFRICDGF